jgi:CBS domain-containing protein
MTTPAVTVYPGHTVAEAVWLLSPACLKRLPVTDHDGRLVGVVQRNALLNAPIRDDAEIREEIESGILAERFPAGAPSTVEVTVRNVVVGLSGHRAEADVPRLLAQIKDLDDVTAVNDHLSGVWVSPGEADPRLPYGRLGIPVPAQRDGDRGWGLDRVLDGAV